MTLVHSWICRHQNIKVILDVQLWELGTQRLHQGLSETIRQRIQKLYNLAVVIEVWFVSMLTSCTIISVK